MTEIAERIRAKLEERGYSAYKLEQLAGLKRSAINNILYGKSKNPGIDIIQSIAKALECSVPELLGASEYAGLSQKGFSQEEVKFLTRFSDKPLDPSLYNQALEAIGTLLQERNLSLSKRQIFECIEEVSNYSIRSGRKDIDLNFADWLLEKYSKE